MATVRATPARPVRDLDGANTKSEITAQGMKLIARPMAGAASLLALAATASGAAAQDCTTTDSVKAATACYNKLLDQANADMQAKYQEAEGPVKRLSQLDQQLVKSQEDWVAYRNHTCDNLGRVLN